MPSDFVPFDLSDEEAAEWGVLRDGIPTSLRSTLLSWIVARIADKGWVTTARLRMIETHCDLNLRTGTLSGMRDRDAMERVGALEDRQILHVTDYLVSVTGTSGPRQSLDAALRAARSKFCVREGPTRWGIGYRVPEGVQDVAETLTSDDTTAGRLLARAWSAAYDLEPNDSLAYANAVKAVETAALRVVGVTKADATVGDVIRAIERKDSTWRLPLKREHTEYPTKTVLLGMLKSLYKGQHDRHGSEAYSDVTHDEALTAVLLATSLVGLFAGGLVEERGDAFR